ncbi:probable isoprenylcysteine alpha-carbonyl methylesterase ICMEL1 [Rhododendron vialii]|uniref:probable isoprenylcysteine alpha-carbonyl methylesterase ICMEL1 n=1 Tax=Rhododendron vialii TaxID=182163 RepID=UPI00265DD20E|nr:probable isoprenylcysteine alpha-carbonyl methylesterase ICMEL1 [Rhododendron vialii]
MQTQILPISTRSIAQPPPPPQSPSPSTTMPDLSSTRLLISPQFDEEKAIEVEPFLPRASSSYTSTSARITNFYQKRRRRNLSETDGSATGRSHSFRERAAFNSDSDMIMTRLCVNLLRYFGLGCRFITRFLALGCYSFLIFPGLVQVGFYYFFSSQVCRGIVYGDQPRNRLDLYLPKESDGPKPVVAFVTGGAWIIGYKAWGSLLGKQLSERDIIVACIDYRNFPRGTMSDMVKDASQGISFVCNHIAEYGGDPNRIYLMGQSAGAHIAACALLEQAVKEAGEGESPSWSVSQLNAYFGLSGAYNLFNLVDHFHCRGFYRSIFVSIMEGEQSFRRFSPEVMVQEPDIKNAVSLLPAVFLIHGTGDYSIPSDASKNFADTLRRVGVKAELLLYDGRTHTDIFVQDPMRGGKDQMFEDLVAIIHAGDSEALAKDAIAPPKKQLVPEFMLNLASSISPF